MNDRRVYLDWNATAPLRAEARAAMGAAMDLVGNPSSIHAEGRAARALIERAREEILEALGAAGATLVFTSGATEAAALAARGRGLLAAPIEHDAVASWCELSLPVDGQGRVAVAAPGQSALQLANSETGIMQSLPEGLFLSDLTQAFGKVPLAFDWSGVQAGIVSAHKLGGPKGVGALVLREGVEVEALIRGGGQELGRRAGTENLIGIAGFAAAARAAQRDLEAGLWTEVARLRDLMERWLAEAVDAVVFIGRGAPRLPNTSAFALPGWKGETQVMQMDLAGFAVSAGSACSSGKVRESRVLAAMGLDAATAGSAIRVSLGPATTEGQIERFVAAWAGRAHRHLARAGAKGQERRTPGAGQAPGAGTGSKPLPQETQGLRVR